MRRLTAICGAALALALGSPTARADIIHLKDGTKVEGEVVDLGDSFRVKLTSGITVVYPRSEVLRIEKTASPAEDYRGRAAGVAPDDAAAQLDLARWCLKLGLATEAERHYRAAAAIASPHHRDATRELAEMLGAAGRFRDAYQLYEALGAEFRSRARAARWEIDRARLAAYQDGVRKLGERAYGAAIDDLGRAWALWLPAPAGETPRAPGAEILARLIEARAGLAAQLETIRISLAACPPCKATGLTACAACTGTGKVKRRVFQAAGADGPPGGQWKVVPCEDCLGSGKARCGTCYGAGVDLGAAASRPRSALRSLGDYAFTHTTSTVDENLRALYRWAVSHVVAVGGGTAPYATSAPLRAKFKALPPSPAELDALAAAWRDAKADVRANFLANVGIELLAMLSPVPPGAFADEAAAAPGAHAAAPRADATELSAFPDDAAGTSVRIRAVWKETAAVPDAVALVVDGGAPHALHPFVWKPEARAGHRAMGAALSLTGLSARAGAYPYDDLAAQVAARRPGDRVELTGRLFAGNDPARRWVLEVWALAVRPGEDVEKMAELLARRVTFRFDNTWLDQAAQMLAELTGVKIALDVPKVELAVSAHVTGAPLGRALGQMLGPLELHWAPRERPEDGIVISAKISDAEREKVAQITELLPQ